MKDSVTRGNNVRKHVLSQLPELASCSREDSKEHPHLAGIYSYTEDYIVTYGIEVRSIERVSSKNATFISFRVEISVSDLSKVLDP